MANEEIMWDDYSEDYEEGYSDEQEEEYVEEEEGQGEDYVEGVDWDVPDDDAEGYDDSDDYESETDEVNDGREGYFSDEQTEPVSDDDAMSRALKIDKGSFKLTVGTISISDIVIPTSLKDSRKETYLGLSRSVEELGVLYPIHVMVLEGYAEYVEENGTEEGYDGPKYLLLDGLRRIFALKKNGQNRVNAVIYDFEDKEKGSDIVNILSMILNKTQRRSWGEVWYLQQVLESQSGLTPGNIEYLLQLEPGDAMKLKEVMTRKDEFPEPAEDLLSKKKSLQQAYNMLNKQMEEEYKNSANPQEYEGAKLQYYMGINQFISSITIPGTSKDSHSYKYTTWNDIVAILSKLSWKDSNMLSPLMAALARKFQSPIDMYIENVDCPHCGKHIERLFVTNIQSQLLFSASRRYQNTEINLIETL